MGTATCEQKAVDFESCQQFCAEEMKAIEKAIESRKISKLTAALAEAEALA